MPANAHAPLTLPGVRSSGGHVSQPVISAASEGLATKPST